MCYNYHITDLFHGSLGWLRDRLTLQVAVLVVTNRQLGLWLDVTVKSKLAVCLNTTWLPVTQLLSFLPIQRNSCIINGTASFLRGQLIYELRSHLVLIPNAENGNWLLSPCGNIWILMHTYVTAYVWRGGDHSEEGLAKKERNGFFVKFFAFDPHWKIWKKCHYK